MALRSALTSFAPLLRRVGTAAASSSSPSTARTKALPSILSTKTQLARPLRQTFSSFSPVTRRFNHSSSSKPDSTSETGITDASPKDTSASSSTPRVEQQPHYRLSFTCAPCNHRSTHTISKQGYHHGSVLIACPNCRNRHIISDHLNMFGDRKITVEDLMREKGQIVKKGTLGEDGDIEFWPEEQAAAQEGVPQKQYKFKFTSESSGDSSNS